MPSTQAPLNRPQSLWDLFVNFNHMSMQGFGGVLAVVQRELVEKKRWLDAEQFAEDWAVAQVLPGPNVVNLGLMLGDRYFGLRGALVTMLGLFTLPLMIVLVLALLYAQFAAVPWVQGAVQGMGAVVAGLIAATGIKLFASVRTSPAGKAGFALAAACSFVLVAWLRVHLLWAIVGVGLPTVLWTYWCIVKSESNKQQGART